MNEGHAAFLALERIREQVAAGLDFDAALELVAAADAELLLFDLPPV